MTANRLLHINEYYFSAKLREVRLLIAQGRPVINLGVGSPDLAPSEAVLTALSDSLRDVSAHQYQSYQGLPELRQAMAEFYQNKFGVNLNPEAEVLPLMGSKEGIFHISMAFLNDGDRVLIPNPSYPTYESVSRLVGAEPMFYDLTEANGWAPDFDAIEKSGVENVKLMWLCYPHMPTGTPGKVEWLRQAVAFAKKHNIILVNDNPYSFILNDNPLSVFQADGAKDVAIELNSLSKTFAMAGWRVGMALANKMLIDAVLKVKSNLDSGMFYGIQKGAIAALKSPQDWFDCQTQIYTTRRELVFELAETLGCTFNRESAGLFVWAKLPDGQNDSEAFVDWLLHEKNIFIAPGTIFGTNGKGYVRFSLCVPDEQILECIKRIRT